MALAARRARESDAGDAPGAHRIGSWQELGPMWSDEAGHTENTDATQRVTGMPRTPSWKRYTTEHAIRSGLLALGAIVVALSATVIALNTSGSSSLSSSPYASGQQSTPARTSAQRNGASSNSSPGSASNPAVSTTLPSSVNPGGPVSADGPPQITSITPSSGAAGRTVTISGTNFLSPDGRIQAYFGEAQAPTSCPVQSRCTVTVPSLSGGPSSVVVKVVTEAGSSNTLLFSYT